MKKVATILAVSLVIVAIGLGIAAVANRHEPTNEGSVVKPKVQTATETTEAESPHTSWADDDH